jgi:hypothetical protein
MKTVLKQLGFSIISFLLACMIVGGGGLLVMRLFPLFYERMTVSSTLDKLAEEPSAVAKSNTELEKELVKKLNEMGDLDRFGEDDIKKYLTFRKTEDGHGRIVSIAYQGEAPVFGDLWLLMKFDKSITLSRPPP